MNCYQCDEVVKWLAPDSRCKNCTRLTPAELQGEVGTEELELEEEEELNFNQLPYEFWPIVSK